MRVSKCSLFTIAVISGLINQMKRSETIFYRGFYKRSHQSTHIDRNTTSKVYVETNP